MNNLHEISRRYQLELAEVESEYWLIKSDYSNSDISEADLLCLLRKRCSKQRPIKGKFGRCIEHEFTEDIFDSFSHLNQDELDEERRLRIDREELEERRLAEIGEGEFAQLSEIARKSESDAEFAKRVGFCQRTIQRLFKSDSLGEKRTKEVRKFVEKFHRRQSLFPTLKEAPKPRRVAKKNKRITRSSASQTLASFQASFI